MDQEIRGMCRSRALSHTIFVHSYDKPILRTLFEREMYWHFTLRDAYNHLETSDTTKHGTDKEIRRKMEQIDDCVLRSMSLGLRLHHCAEIAYDD